MQRQSFVECIGQCGILELAMNYEEAIKSLQETAIVMAEIQRRQSEVQKLQAAEPNTISKHEQRQRQHEQWFQRIEANLAEITGKLNRLIGSGGDGRPKQPPQ